MTAGPETTALVLGQCQKCQTYVFTSLVAGITTIVDPAPLNNIAEYAKALAAGKSLYRKLSGERLGASRNTDLTYSGSQLWATHACAAAGVVRASRVEVAREGPSAPICDAWRASGWSPPTSCPRVGAEALSGRLGDTLFQGVTVPLSCKTCEPPPFEVKAAKPTRCAICHKGPISGNDKDVYAIEYDGRTVWAIHDH